MAWSAALVPVVLILVALFGTYERVAVSRGVIEPTGGVTSVQGLRRGTITNLRAFAGTHIERGSTLAVVETESGDGSYASYAQQALDSQIALDELQHQVSLAEEQYTHEERRLRAQIRAWRDEQQILERQISIQREVVDLARRRWERYTTLRESGNIASAAVDDLRGAYIQSQSALHEVQRRNSELGANITNTQASITTAEDQRDLTISRLRIEIIRVQQQQRSYQLSASYTLTAPISGLVAAVLHDEGDTIGPGEVLTVIIPEDTPLFATVYLSTADAGEVEAGQTVRLKLDAFPQEQYGTLNGIVETIDQVSVNALAQPLSLMDGQGVFRASVRILAPGENSSITLERIRVGMTLSADIALERRPLWHWVAFSNAR